jgi:hypothetical protein
MGGIDRAADEEVDVGRLFEGLLANKEAPSCL